MMPSFPFAARPVAAGTDTAEIPCRKRFAGEDQRCVGSRRSRPSSLSLSVRTYVGVMQIRAQIGVWQRGN